MTTARYPDRQTTWITSIRNKETINVYPTDIYNQDYAKQCDNSNEMNKFLEKIQLIGAPG